MWQQALSRLCNANQILHNPLGRWVRKSPWLFDPGTERLFLDQGHSVLEYQLLRTRRSRHSWATFAHPVERSDVPCSALPASVIPGNNPVMTGFSTLIAPVTSASRTLSQFLSNIDRNARWVVQNVEVLGDWAAWARDSSHTLYGVSDGSFKDEYGTAAFILTASDDPQVSIRGRVVTPGNRKDQNAYRSELAGIYAMTILQWAVSEFFGIKTGTIEVACDGKSALEQAQWPEDFINTNYPHYDLILAIRSVRLLTQWDWSWRHVKGHQDDKGVALDFWAQLNVEMDTNAKKHWADTHLVVAPSQRIWGEPWSIWLGPHQKITLNLSKTLQEHCSAQSAKDYWKSITKNWIEL
jgi:hypothetical protein